MNKTITKSVIAGALLIATGCASASTVYNFSGTNVNGYFSVADGFAIGGSAVSGVDFINSLDDFSFTGPLMNLCFTGCAYTFDAAKSTVWTSATITFDSTASSFTIGSGYMAITDASGLDEIQFWGNDANEYTNGWADVTFNTLTTDPLTASAYNSAIAPVPLPAAVWLFGSGLIGLVGFAKRKV